LALLFATPAATFTQQESTPPAAQDAAAPPLEHRPGRIRVGGSVAQAEIVKQVPPEYPPMARTAHIEGTVILHAIIATDGSVKDLEYVSGPMLLMQAAMDAVHQWQYKPMTINGEPVEVDTTISVLFRLGGKKQPEAASASPPVSTAAAEGAPAHGYSVSGYPDKTSGLKKLLQDIMKAEKDADQQRLKPFWDSFALPNPDTWFAQVFGSRFGPMMAKTYMQQTPYIAKQLDKAFANALRDKMNDVETRRFENACDSAADQSEYPILAARQQQQAFYEARLIRGGYGTVLTLFAYVDGAFRYIPGLKVPQLVTNFRITRAVSSADSGPASDTDVQPVAITHQVPPDYPQEAQREQRTGSVKFNVLIGSDGKIKEIYPLAGTCIFVQAAEKAVKKWTFTPATVNGEPNEAYTTLTVDFGLNSN